MLWLIWQMWFFLILAFLIGLGLGWRLWSASGEAGKALQAAKDEIGRLQRENDSLSSVAARHQAALEVSQSSAKAAPETVEGKGDDSAKAASIPIEVNDLTALKGVGPKAAEALNAGGVTSFEQIAAWTVADIAKWDEALTARGRIERDDWVGQAKAKLA
jgi:predicted flap endonuclease-1-like 5' DNA nuclease